MGNYQEGGFTIENYVIISVFKFGILNPSQFELHLFFHVPLISSQDILSALDIHRLPKRFI